MIRRYGIWALFLIYSLPLRGDILTASSGKHFGSFSGAADVEGNGDFTATFVFNSPILNQGKPSAPVGYGDVPGSGPSDAIPVFPNNGTEVVATVSDLQLFLAYDASAQSWVSASQLASYTPHVGDVMLYADPNQLRAGGAAMDGGSFQVFHNVSGSQFDPTSMDPATSYLAEGVQQLNTGAITNDLLLGGEFQNLLANGVSLTHNLSLAGTSLLDASIPDLFGSSAASYALLAVDVTGDASTGGLAVKIPDWTTNVRLTGGSEFARVRKGGMKIESQPGIDTGSYTDFRWTAAMAEIPGVVFGDSPNLQDLSVVDSSFSYVSTPEPTSLALYGIGLAGLMLLRSRRRR